MTGRGDVHLSATATIQADAVAQRRVLTYGGAARLVRAGVDDVDLAAPHREDGLN